MSFVHLHNHSDFSVLDGAIPVKKMISLAVKHGMKAVALTDHGNMAGSIAFFSEAKRSGIKPILGQEFYIAPKSRFDRSAARDEETAYHLILLAETLEGYHNLMKLSSIGYTEGFYYKPRIDFETLAANSKGLICSSACLAGEIPQLIMQGKTEDAKKVALKFKELFGPERFYLEMQDHGIREQKMVNKVLAEFSSRLDIPLIATNDCHYPEKADAFAHEVLLCVQTGKTITDESRMKFDSSEFYFKSGAEMERLFGELPDAIFNTGKIADMCDVELELDKPVLPAFAVPEGFTLDSYMAHLVAEGAAKHYGSPVPAEVKERIDYELGVISKMGFAGYFLIVWDFINYARKNGIPVGPGRGSAAGSIVSFCMGITQLNPLAYNLLFERFLNPDRREMPDMDIDFCAVKREAVIDYVRQRYGEEHVSQIITFNTMAPKAVVKDVARVMNIPFAKSNEITKMITEENLEKSIAASKDLQNFIKESEENKTLIEISRKLEGLTRSFGKHAAGVVISRGKLTDYAPLYKDPKEGAIITQFDKIDAEHAGLVKMDFLGLKNLTIIDHALRLIHETEPDFDIESLPLDDTDTYKLLQKGDTTGVFQLESSGMQSLLRRMIPTEFEDIIACGALFRPGPLESGMADQYVQRKRDHSLVSYPHPVLEPILKDTLGVIVYQEQVMKISQAMGGFSMGEADKLRKAMGKKKKDIVDEMREKFLKGAKEKKIPQNIATEIYDAMSKFAQYGFNKSHAAAYGLVTYQTGYLKTHYRPQYMCALLSAYIGDKDDVTTYIKDAKAAGISILPPDVNRSRAEFSIENGKDIRFGLNAVKGLGAKAIADIIDAREKLGGFDSLKSFLENVPVGALNRGTLEALIKSGALAALEPNRARLLTAVEYLGDTARRLQGEKNSGQGNLFAALGDESLTGVELPSINDFPDSVKLAYEKEVLGIYVSGHPLEKYERELRAFSSCTTGSLDGIKNQGAVTLVGLIENPQKKISKKGKPYVTALLEDLDGTVNLFIFEKTLAKCERTVFGKEIVMVSGKMDIEEDGGQMKLIADDVIPLSEARKKAISAVHVSIEPVGLDDATLEKLRAIFESNKGGCPVYFHVPDRMAGESIIKANSYYSITPTEQLIQAIAAETGPESVRFSFKSCG